MKATTTTTTTMATTISRCGAAVVAVALSAAAAPSAHGAPLRVYLQGGQSNADGRAEVSGLPAGLQSPQADVPFYYHFEGAPAPGGVPGTLTTLRPGASESGTGNFGPEVTFGRGLANFAAATGTGASVAIIKYANGGTSLHTQWKAGGSAATTGDGAEYVTFQQTVNAGLAALAAANPGAQVQLAGMIWVQGETDANDSTVAAAYGTNLTAFIGDVRQTYGTNLPFFLSRLSDNQTAVGTANANAVRAGQASTAAALPNVYMLDTDAAAFSMKSDNLHFDTAGQQALGTAFAQSAIAAGTVPEPGTVGLLACGAGVLVRRRRRTRTRRLG